MATTRKRKKQAPVQEAKPNPVPKQQQPADWLEILRRIEW